MIAAQICPMFWGAKIQSILMNRQKRKSFLHAAGWRYFYGSVVHSGALLVPAQRGTAAPAFQSHTPSLQPPRGMGWSPAGTEVATNGPWLWAALAQWGLDPSPDRSRMGFEAPVPWCRRVPIVIPCCKTKVTEQGIMQRCLVFTFPALCHCRPNGNLLGYYTR